MVKSHIKCLRDVIEDGKVVFTSGNVYQVVDKGNQWKTKDDKGETMVVVKGSEHEKRLIGEFFEW